MTTYSTGNPLGSSDPRDLYDNAENLDNLVNGEAAAYNDRLGKSRKSWQGIEGEFAAFIAAGGYVGTGMDGAVENYAAGIEITGYNQIVRDASGEFWRLSGPVALPYTTTGAGLPEGGAFVSVGDAVLRQELSGSPADGKGASLVNGAVIYVGSVAEGLAGREVVDGQSYDVLGFDSANGVGAQSLIGDVSAPKSQHGISGWSPTVPPVSAQAGATRAARVSNYLAGVGETDPLGSGLFLRKNKKIYNICEYGAVPNASEPVDASLTAAADAMLDGATLTGNPGDYIISQPTTYLGRYPDGSYGKRVFADWRGVTFISQIDQPTRFLVRGKTTFTNAKMDKVHVFLDQGSDESEVSGNEFINQNNHFIRTEVNKATITKNVFKSTGSAAAFFNCIAVIRNAAGTRIFGNDFNYTAGGAINVDATNGFITEDTLIYGNRFFCNGLKEPSSSVKIEATTRVIIHGNIMDGNNRAGNYGVFLVGTVTGEISPGGIRRVLISDNIVTGYSRFLFIARSSSTYGGNPAYSTDVIVSGNIIDNCGNAIRRAGGSLEITGNTFRDNGTDIDASEASDSNGQLHVSGNKFFNSETASIQLGNLTDNSSVSVPEARIEFNVFRGWNAGNGAGRENVCAVYQKRNAFVGSGQATTRPLLVIRGNSFNTATGNEVNCLAVEEASVIIKENTVGGTIALDRNVLLHPQSSGDFYIPKPVVYENNSWQLVTAAPTIGKHLKGEIWKNDNPASGGHQYWVCVISGDFDSTNSDPIFKTMGAIT